MGPREVSCTPLSGGDLSPWSLFLKPIPTRRSPQLIKQSGEGRRSPAHNYGPAHRVRVSNYPRPPPVRKLEERGRSVKLATRTTSSRLCRAHSRSRALVLADRHKAAELHQRRCLHGSQPFGRGSSSRAFSWAGLGAFRPSCTLVAVLAGFIPPNAETTWRGGQGSPLADRVASGRGCPPCSSPLQKGST
jgi:hypothetical protein